jgi:hypothetical protein
MVAVTVKSGNQDLGQLTACGTSAEEYFLCSKDGVPWYQITKASNMPARLQMSKDAGGLRYTMYISGSAYEPVTNSTVMSMFGLSRQGYGILMEGELGTVQSDGDVRINLNGGGDVMYNMSYSGNSMQYTITGFGGINEYFTGTFSGPVTDSDGKMHTLSGSFRLLRHE